MTSYEQFKLTEEINKAINHQNPLTIDDIKHFVDAGIDLNYSYYGGSVVNRLFSRPGLTKEFVEYVIRSGGNINLKDSCRNSFTPFHIICGNTDDIDIIQCAVDLGGNINDKNAIGLSQICSLLVK